MYQNLDTQAIELQKITQDILFLKRKIIELSFQRQNPQQSINNDNCEKNLDNNFTLTENEIQSSKQANTQRDYYSSQKNFREIDEFEQQKKLKHQICTSFSEDNKILETEIKKLEKQFLELQQWQQSFQNQVLNQEQNTYKELQIINSKIEFQEKTNRELLQNLINEQFTLLEQNIENKIIRKIDDQTSKYGKQIYQYDQNIQKALQLNEKSSQDLQILDIQIKSLESKVQQQLQFSQNQSQVEQTQKQIQQLYQYYETNSINNSDYKNQLDNIQKSIANQLENLKQQNSEQIRIQITQQLSSMEQILKQQINIKFDEINQKQKQDETNQLKLKQSQEYESLNNLIESLKQQIEQFQTSIDENQIQLQQLIQKNKEIDINNLEIQNQMENIQKASELLRNETNEKLSLMEQNLEQKIIKQYDEFSKKIVPSDQIVEITQHPDQVRLAFVQNIINNLYSSTTRRRSVTQAMQYFIHQIQSQSEIGQHYHLKLDQKKIINQYCSGFIQVRGDGNCFYTSFGYQYLQILINQYDENQYRQFIDQVVKKMKFMIQYNQIKLEDEETQSKLREEFIYRLDLIKKIQDQIVRQNELIKQFQAYEYDEEQRVDGCFYALSTIFFRNLSLYIIEQDESNDVFFEKDTLLKWEVECNSNEIVISKLANYLKINIVLFYLDQENFNMMQYNKESNIKVILLLKPGHYNIGIPKQN